MKAAAVRRDAVWQNLQSQEISHTTDAAIRRTPTRRPLIAFVNVESEIYSQAEASIGHQRLDKAADSQVPESSEHAVSTRKSLRSV